MSKDKLAVVTGAGGFIGSHLVDALVAQGQSVRALVMYNPNGRWGWLEHYRAETPANLEVVLGDVRDVEQMRDLVSGAAVVYHLAALIGIPYSYRAGRSYVDTNVGGTLNLLQAARAVGVERFVHTSTSEVYGSAQYCPIDEAHPLQGQSPYSASKIGADKMAESFWCSFELPVVTVRPFNTFGPRQSMRAVIPTIIRQALAGNEVRLGSLWPKRDLTYVADTVAGFVAAASAGEEALGKVYNLGVGASISIGELAELIIGQIEGDQVIVAEDARRRPERSEVRELLSNNKQALSGLGWQPKYSLRDGLAETIDWCRKTGRDGVAAFVD